MNSTRSHTISGFASFVAVLFALLLAACSGGGGGGSSGPVVSANTFPLLTAFANQINNGFSHSGTMTGTAVDSAKGITLQITGTFSINRSPATATVFEGQAALMNDDTTSGTMTIAGETTPLSGTSTMYWSTNYMPLGYTGNEYWVMQGAVVVPSTGKVGDSVIIGTFNRYADSSKTTLLGTTQLSLTIEADTASTAIVNMVEQEYDTENNLLYTEQMRWRIDVSGNLEWVTDTASGLSQGVDMTYTIN